MKRFLMSYSAIIFLTGCALQQPTTTHPYVPAQPMVQQSARIQVPDQAQLRYGNDPALMRAFRQYTKTGRAATIITDGFIKFAYNSEQQPIIQTVPLQETVISLEPGEKFTNISSGDPNRWSYAVAVSGVDSMQQQHVLVKPSQANIATNMVITTDKHLYNLKLVSAKNKRITKQVSFWYPEAMVAEVNRISQMNHSTITSLPDINLSQLNFNYRISCDRLCKTLAWAPTRVFDDGRHSYIQFPANISHHDMPALFVVTDGAKELVNYRVKAPYFIVDKLFQQAKLVLGVGSSKREVTLTNLSHPG